MKTIEQFKDEITQEFMAMDAVRRLYGLDGTETFRERFPTVSVEGIFLYLWAVGAWIIATLFDKHREDVLAELAALKPHTLLWYVTKAKAYQHGSELPKDESGQYCADVYETPEPKKRIVRYAVANEVEKGDTIAISLKVAKYTSPDDHTPIPLTVDEMEGFKRYLANIKDAGVPINVLSEQADLMQVEMAVYYNPVLLSASEGKLLDAAGEDVVRRAIERVIENLPFNGDCRNSDILDAVKGIEGVEVADILSVRSKPFKQNYCPVVGYCTPRSGYFKLEKLALTLKPYDNGNKGIERE